MVQDVVAKLVIRERIEGAGVLIDRPVSSEFLRAQDEDAFVPELEIFDDGKSCVCFAQAHAVCEDTPVEVENLVNGSLGAVFLKVEERPPDVSVRERDAPEGVINVAR